MSPALQWTTADEVIKVHSCIIQVSGGIDGIRDRASLEAALAAPLQSFDGHDLFPTRLEKIVRLGYGLASNHAFVDGNKRIGAMMMQLLLEQNGYSVIFPEGTLSTMFINIAAGKASERDLLFWVILNLQI